MPELALRVLIVEDDYFIANDLAKGFEEAGQEIVGPVPSLAKALTLLDAEKIDAAILDINLDGEKVFEVADALIDRDVPVVFVTGYERSGIPDAYGHIPLCVKPVDAEKVVTALTRATGR